jgi:hypothetical protein
MIKRARQYMKNTANIAIQICPNAQPIDKTIGVEALET